VLAIAITLLVLDLAIRPPGSPTEEFFRAWPSYVVPIVAIALYFARWRSSWSCRSRLAREIFRRAPST
jgi:hypothetical protein